MTAPGPALGATLALVALLVLPLAGALVAVMSGRRGGAAALGVAAAMIVAVAVLGSAVLRDGPIRIAIGGWAPPLGIGLRADGLAIGFLAMTALVMTAVLVSARPAFAGPQESRAGWAFWPLALMLWAAVNAVFLSQDLFNLYVGLELLTLAAVALVAIDGGAERLAAALRYLVYALTGSLLYLAGAALIHAGHGTLDIASLALRDGASGADLVAAGLMTAGLAVKTALFPFHAWLPPAHAGAPAPASAMLSALVPKASFVILLRLWFEAVPDLATPALLALLGGMGALAVLHGSLMALRQVRLKLIVAYSTVAQIGYLFLVFPLAGGDSIVQPWAAGAWSGAIFLALGHGLAKAAMFLCAGLWVMAAGHDRLDGMAGLARAMPMTVLAFGLAALTLTGLPPSAGFTAKYLMLTSAFASGRFVLAGVLVLGGLAAAAYLYRPLVMTLRPGGTAFRPVGRGLQAVPLLLACAAILLGLASNLPYELLQIGRPAAAAEGLE